MNNNNNNNNNKQHHFYLFLIIALLYIFSSSSNSFSYADDCNKEVILPDWGFKELATVEPEYNNSTGTFVIQSQYWILEYPPHINVSFVTKLLENFDNTEIVGYNAIRVSLNSSVPFKKNQWRLTSINHNLNLTAPDCYNFVAVFRQSSVLDNINTAISMDRMGFGGKLATNSQFYRVYQYFEYENTEFEKWYPIEVDFSEQSDTTSNIVYIEDLKLFQQCFNSSEVVYVSNNGSDITGTGTIDNPFSSIQQALSVPYVNNITVEAGFYCGLGNSWIIPTGSISIQGPKDGTQAILSGEGSLMIFDYQMWDSNLVIIDSFVFTNTSNRIPGGFIRATGSSSLSSINNIFTNSTSHFVPILLNFLNDVSFYSNTFEKYNNYAIQAQGVSSGYLMTIESCTFTQTRSIDAVGFQQITILSTNFFGGNIDGSLEQVDCGLNFMMNGELEFYNSVIQTPICVSHSQTNILSSYISFGYAAQGKFNTFILSQSSFLYLNNVEFNSVPASSCILAFHGEVFIENSLFNNVACQKTINVEQGYLVTYNTTFQGTADTIFLDNSAMKMVETTFTDVNSFLITTSSNVTIFDSYFYYARQSSLSHDSSIFIKNSTLYSSLSIDDRVFSQPIWNLTGGSYDDISSTIIGSGEDGKGGGFINSLGCSISLNGTSITNFSSNFSIIQAQGVSDLHFYEINAKYNYVSSRSGAFLALYDTSIAYFNHSVLSWNTCAENGGVIFSTDDTSVFMYDCECNDNKATLGGFYSSDSFNTNLTIEYGNYDNNYASQGNFIYYMGSKPIIVGDVIKDISDQISLGQISLSIDKDIPDLIDSGSTGYYIDVQLVDSKGDALNHKFCASCSLFLFFENSLLAVQPINKTGTIFSDITLVGIIGANQTIHISSDDNTIQSYSFTVGIKTCEYSFIPNAANNLCQQCSPRTYGLDGVTCKPCPENVLCLGGQDFFAEEGFWIDPNFTNATNGLTAFPCPDGVCEGNDICAPHYDGPLCADCEAGYYNCGAGCKVADKTNVLVVFIKLITFFTLVLTQQISSDSSGLVPIVLYFLQTLVVISTSGIKFTLWNILSGATTSHNSGTVSNGPLSYLNDCIGPYGFYWNHYFILLQPIFLFVILAFIILLEYILRKTGIIFKIPIIKSIVEKSEKEFRLRQASAFIKICMNSYGPLITEILLIFFCGQVGTYLLLNANPAIQCNTHEYYLSSRISQGLLAIVILFPIIILIVLYRHKNKLDDVHVQRKLGVFYLKYKSNFYFWDVILLIKRIAIVTLSLLDIYSPYRSMSLVLLCLASLFIQIKFQPFLSNKDNYLETISLTLLFVSCIYLDNTLYKTTEQYVLIICVVLFIIAAIKLQGNYYWNQLKEIASPILQGIISKTSRWRSKKSKNEQDFEEFKKNYTFSYDEEDTYDQDPNHNENNIIGRVDRLKLINNHKSNHLNYTYTSINQDYNMYEQDDDDNSDNDNYNNNYNSNFLND